MSAKIQAALGLLQDDPENELAWTELADVVTAPDPGLPLGELKSLLEAARRGHEIRREWDAVARVLELEMLLHADTPVELAMLFELARVFDEECFDTEKAEATYARLRELRPDDDSVLEALERHRKGRSDWKPLSDDLIQRAEAESDPVTASSMLFQAAELLHRFGDAESAQQAVTHL